MNHIHKAVRVIRRDGLYGFLNKSIDLAYSRLIAPRLPKTKANYNGIDVYGARPLDSILPWRTKDRPYYESGIVKSINQNIDQGDKVIIVGGGWGVTAVKAAQKTGESGKVTVYEGSIEEVNHVRETIDLNHVSNIVAIKHSIVGPKISLRGKEGGASHLSPEDLPECDVLELDCEGSEVEILKNLKIRPRVILVESHGLYDAPSSKIENLLKGMSYSIVSKEVACEDIEEYHKDHDVYAITAIRE